MMRSRLFCNHDWLTGRHPVTLEITERRCQLCGKAERPSVMWGSRVAPLAAFFLTGIMLAGGVGYYLGGERACRHQAERLDELDRSVSRLVERFGIPAMSQ